MAVLSRVHNKLDFMTQLFREGTVSDLIIRSNARIVWINDWFPLKVRLSFYNQDDKVSLLMLFVLYLQKLAKIFSLLCCLGTDLCNCC